jgi:hypothetical protein
VGTVVTIVGLLIYTNHIYSDTIMTDVRPSRMKCRKGNAVYPIRTTSFVSIVIYLTCTIIIL